MRTRPALPVIDPDPDARSVRWGWAIWAGCTLAGLGWLLLDASPLRMAMLAPIAVLLLGWPAWRLGGAALRTLREADAWHGAHHEFDGQRIRIITDCADRLWFAVDDVLDAMQLTGHARSPARLRLIAGRDGVVRAPGTRLLCFGERALLAWLERRTEPRAAAFARWLETQVLRPHRRRAEIEGRAEPAQEMADATRQTVARRNE